MGGEGGGDHHGDYQEQPNYKLTKKPPSATAAAAAAGISHHHHHFVLVHGICGGAWCWYKVKSLLEVSGYRATCLDLKGAGIDPTDVDTILTFEDYNRPLDEFMDSLPEKEKVVLVGHSAGGLSVTQCMYKYPDKVVGAVFVAATMLKLGFQSLEDLKIGAPNVSEHGCVFEYGYGLGKDRPPTSARFKPEYLRKLVYQLSPLEDYTLATMLSRPGPLLALTTAQFTNHPAVPDPGGDGGGGDSNRGNEKINGSGCPPKVVPSPPHVYIKTNHDNVMKREQQEAMIQRWQPLAVYEMDDSDHSPFMSDPLTLSRLLLKAANLFHNSNSN